MSGDLQAMVAEIRRRRQMQLQQIMRQGQQGGQGGGVALGGGGDAPQLRQSLVGGLVREDLGKEANVLLQPQSQAPQAQGSRIINLLGGLISTKRVKQNIETLQHVRELRWVDFEYLPELGLGGRHRGLIAEEVAVTHPEWVFRDDAGRPLGVYYTRIPRELWPTA